jgi:hypothetical protein
MVVEDHPALASELRALLVELEPDERRPGGSTELNVRRLLEEAFR